MKLEISYNLKRATPLEGALIEWIEKGLLQTTIMIQNQAKINAPYLTWTLRRSITSDLTRLNKLTTTIWSPVIYSRRREYENKKNPDRKFYLKRAYTENINKIWDIFNKVIKLKLW